MTIEDQKLLLSSDKHSLAVQQKAEEVLDDMIDKLKATGAPHCLVIQAVLSCAVRQLARNLSVEHACRWLRDLADEMADAIDTTTVH